MQFKYGFTDHLFNPNSKVLCAREGGCWTHGYRRVRQLTSVKEVLDLFHEAGERWSLIQDE